MKQNLVITILSDSPFITTGYSDQCKKLVNYLTDKGHEVHWLANGHMGKTIEYARLDDGTEVKAKVYGRIQHQYFGDMLSSHLKKTNSDIFLVVLDTFMLHGDPKNPRNGWFLNIDTAPAKTIFWYPSDGGGGMPIGCDLILKKMDLAVAYSKFAQQQVKDYYGLETPYIPLGTEKKRFFKMSDIERHKLKQKYGLQGKFIVGSVFRNQPRKFPDRLIKTFKEVAKKIPNAVLFLHTDPNDPAAPFSMSSLIRRLGLENRVVFSGMNAMNSFDWTQMNEVYNLMDVFFLATSGEGWGIPFVEAMSAEVPVVATLYTTTQEIIVDHKAGFGAKLAGTENINMFGMKQNEYDEEVMNGTLSGTWEVERGFCDIKDAAEKIIDLYNRPELREEMGKNGRKAVEEEYDQDIVNKKWEETFLNLCKSG